MPIRLPSSSFKTNVAVVIAGAFSVAVAVSFSIPSVSHSVVSCFPFIYDNTVFLLKPPYLYLLINFIIVSIVASSKLTQKSSSIDDSDFSEVSTPVSVPDIDTGYLNVNHVVASDYTGFLAKYDVQDDTPVYLAVEDVREFPEIIADDKQTVDDAPVDLAVEDVREFPEITADDKRTVDDGEKQQPESEILKPSNDSPEPETEIPKLKSDALEISILKQTRKPPRFGQQKSLRFSPEGGNKKTVLGVSKPPRRQDTLETTWKKIMEGRSTPLTKHLNKSDTWKEMSHVQEKSAKQKKEKMTKSENLNDRDAPTEETRLNREPSPGQEELNRRVEAFIKKFNEEMRLQRLESLAKYNEMVNGGTSS